MDWTQVLILPNGRMARRYFWLAVIILALVTWTWGGLTAFAAYPVSAWLHGLGLLLLLYPKYSVFSARLHDIGWPGWPALPILAAGAVTDFLSTLITGIATAHAGSASETFELARDASRAFHSSKPVGAVMLLSFGLLLVAGLIKGSAGDNRFGRPNPARARAETIASDDMSAH